MKEKIIMGKVAERQKFKEQELRAVEDQTKKNDNQPKGGWGSTKSVLEPLERRAEGPVMAAVRDLWRR